MHSEFKTHSRCLLAGPALGLLTLLGGCLNLPEATPYSELSVPESAQPEMQLLDVGILIFDPGVEAGTELDYSTYAIRQAEASYIPVVLQRTLRETGSWGNLFVLAVDSDHIDVKVSGSILESSGHTLRLSVSIADASGTNWFKKQYAASVDESVYGPRSLGVNDPFQSLYNQIANDLQAYAAENLTASSIARIRQVSALKFARRFAPDPFSSYLEKDKEGVYQIVYLPAVHDPLASRLAEIRQRDKMFLHTLGDNYVNFARRMGETYFYWRRDVFEQMREVEQAQRAAAFRMVNGGVWLGAAAAAGNAQSVLGTVASIAGGYAGSGRIADGFARFQQSTLFIEELTNSFSTEISTGVIQLDDRSITLTGTVNEIYEQWQDVLREIYFLETGFGGTPAGTRQ